MKNLIIAATLALSSIAAPVAAHAGAPNEFGGARNHHDRGANVQATYAPTFVQPQYAQPVYAPPVYVQPQYAQPVYVQPTGHDHLATIAASGAIVATRHVATTVGSMAPVAVTREGGSSRMAAKAGAGSSNGGA